MKLFAIPTADTTSKSRDLEIDIEKWVCSMQKIECKDIVACIMTIYGTLQKRFGNNTLTSPPIVQYQVPFHPLQPPLAVSGEIILYPATTSPAWMLKDILISMPHLERHLDSSIYTRPDMLAQQVRTPSILVVVGVC